MKRIQFKDISVFIYTSADEFIHDYYDLPEGAIMDKDSIPETAGFADIDGRCIAIYTTKLSSFRDLFSTVSHELGHLIENGFKKNPPQKPRYDKRHEQKAEHYESFSIDAYDLSRKIYGMTFTDL